ncbi:MAG: single-stranded-DNA-specific exonuclease RecJ [Anaerolineae bacterium]|nr:single-stranded-DNA-specific exonuclease RecJ [Anaerolineae bacterium]
MRFASQEWVEPSPVNLPANYQQAIGGHPLVAEALWRRGLDTTEKARAFLDPHLFSPTSPFELPDMQAAVERIQTALQNNQKILIWGDFDVDGQTATAVLVCALRNLGANVEYHLPIRAQESHGISLPSLQQYLKNHFQLVVTCDTGISAADAVAYAASCHVDMIITDHHALPTELPNALAVINPQRVNPDHPLFHLCGVGCAYKLVEALYRQQQKSEQLSSLLDLVALGTIADLAVLSGENRYLVQRGLQALRSNPRPAIQAILALSDINPAHLTEEHISFILAPRMNALGRLGDANPIVEFLLTQSADHAALMAIELERLNGQRKLLAEQIFQSALSMIEQDRSILDSPVLILNHPDWDASVIGIVASRLVDIFQRPTALITTPIGQPARGSIRSIANINIASAIAAQQHLLLTHGGHPMAAGFALLPENMAEFRRSLAQTIAQISPEQPQTQKLLIDAFIPLQDITLDLVADLDRLAPFGPGNRPLTLATRGLKLVSYNPIGKNEDHLLLIVEDSTGAQQRVVWWQGAGSPLPEGYFDLAYTVRASNYQGQHQVQIEWIGFRDSETATETLITAAKPREIVDYRQHENPQALLPVLLTGSSTVMWAEGELYPSQAGLSRYHLLPATTLIIWSIPPGRKELMDAIRKVNPQKIILMGINPGFDRFEVFTPRLGGMIRYAISKHGGWISIMKMAIATAQREETIRKGIAWFIARGDIQLIKEENERLQFALCGQTNKPAIAKAESDLRALLNETAAFRNYYLRANPDYLLAYSD